MKARRRIHDTLLNEHLASHRQMALISGPRQVGKPTTCQGHTQARVNWDNVDDRQRILAGPAQLTQQLKLDRLTAATLTVLFDELHKYPSWKQFLKGFFDTYSDRVKTIVTCSSRLDVYRRSGDSLLGRYFHYRMHPFSIAETITTDLPDASNIGLGELELGYLGDKEKREVDFIVIRDGSPWFLVDVKHPDTSISGTLGYYQRQLDAPFAFQAVIDTEYVDADCFARPREPITVPARTLLSQLL